jgi:hypothetical protein
MIALACFTRSDEHIHSIVELLHFVFDGGTENVDSLHHLLRAYVAWEGRGAMGRSRCWYGGTSWDPVIDPCALAPRISAPWPQISRTTCLESERPNLKLDPLGMCEGRSEAYPPSIPDLSPKNLHVDPHPEVRVHPPGQIVWRPVARSSTH